MTTPIPCAVYYRMSDDRQENSIDRQKSQVIPYAEKHGYQIIREYVDEGIPGDEIAKRRQFQRMLRDAHAGQFQGILCDDKDRFGRFDVIDLGEIVAPLRRKGVWLETVAQGRVDWNSFSGRITDAILQEAKSMESEAISRRVLSAQLIKAQKGVTTGGRACYGYRWEADPRQGKKLVPDGRKADVVRLCFRLYAEGQTLGQLARELYERGVPAPRGKGRWTRCVLMRLLINRRYLGDWTWGVHPQGKRHRYGQGGLRPSSRSNRGPRRNPADSWVVIVDTHEPLVDRDTFERVQVRLQENKGQTSPVPGGLGFVLNRLLICSHCGSNLTGVNAKSRYRTYICRGYLNHGREYCQRNPIGEKPLVNFLVRKLKETFLDPDNLEKLRAEMRAQEARQRGEVNLGRLRRRAEDLAQKIDQGNERLAILPADRVPGVIQVIRKWERERDEVLAELERAEKQSPVEALEEMIAAAEAALWRLQEAARDEDRPLLRDVLREMISRVELRWEHEERNGRTRSRLTSGVVRLQATEGISELFPSAGQSHC
jgi:DNA invertase Pin-like site-specific DNA recombinase